jgi:hypothetical protein
MNSEEAAEQMVRVGESVKPDISPIYWETPAISGLSVDEQKEFLVTRNKLMKIQRGLPVDDLEDELWGVLECMMHKAQF